MRICLIIVIIGLSACAPPAPPPSTPPPEVAEGTSAVRPTAALLDPFAGRYSQANQSLTVRRVGDALIVERSGQPPLPLTLIGFGTFADAAGNAYLFHASGRLSIVAPGGSRSEWVR